MAYNKIIYGGNTLIDLTSDTITADKMVNGETAHNNAGTQIMGTLVIQNYYTGSGAPSASLGNNGDIYLQE